MRVEMHTVWIGVASTLPLFVALLAAWPIWARGVGDEIGSIAGAGVIFVFVIVFIGREFAEIQTLQEQCRAANIGCRFVPAPFTRYAIYAIVGMAEVFAVFVVGLWAEERRRRKRHRQ